MLARNYDNYAWQEEQYDESYIREESASKRQSVDNHKLLRRRAFVIAAILMATYLFAVVRSEAMVRYGNELVSLKRQETQMINKNNELKIEVEQLKGPERILSIAENKLGLSVARSNIYVKAGTKNNNAAYALAK